MKKTALLLTILAATFLGGCDVNTPTHNGGRGMVDAPRDRQRRVAACNDYYSRQLMDDWDLLWLYDRNTNLSEWKIYIGH